LDGGPFAGGTKPKMIYIANPELQVIIIFCYFYGRLSGSPEIFPREVSLMALRMTDDENDEPVRRPSDFTQ
jgi:hypothetical protein